VFLRPFPKLGEYSWYRCHQPVLVKSTAIRIFDNSIFSPRLPSYRVYSCPRPMPHSKRRRATDRSTAPSNRVTSVPVSRSFAPSTAVTGVLGPPPPSPLTTTQQQQRQQQQRFTSSSRQQYANAPRLQRSSSSSPSFHPSSQQQLQHYQQPRQCSTVPPHVQQNQQPQPNPQQSMQTKNSGVAPALGYSLMTVQEKKEEKRFQVFATVLMK
jgi:hypothetical protein